MDNRPTMPPLFRLGTIPHFPGGGPVFAVPNRALETRAGKALAACTNARQGRLVLDSDRDARWIARRGDVDHDHTPAVAFEGRARKGEAFHLYVWEDGSLAVAAFHGKPLLALPCALQMPSPINLGTLGAGWYATWENGQGALMEHRPRHRRRPGHSESIAKNTPFFPETDTNSTHPRPAAVLRAALLQAMSDLAERILQQPPVLWPVTEVPRAGWTVPTFAGSGAPKGGNAGLERLVHKALFPALARALVAQQLAPNGPPIKVFVRHTMPTGLGVIAPPQLEVAQSSEQAFVRTALYKAFVKEAQAVFALAWQQGNLGSVWPWCSLSEPAVEVLFEPAAFSRHAILAAMAPKHTIKAKPTTPPPPVEPPWWAHMLGEDL